jgi:hypothetical protein
MYIEVWNTGRITHVFQSPSSETKVGNIMWTQSRHVWATQHSFSGMSSREFIQQQTYHYSSLLRRLHSLHFYLVGGQRDHKLPYTCTNTFLCSIGPLRSHRRSKRGSHMPRTHNEKQPNNTKRQLLQRYVKFAQYGDYGSNRRRVEFLTHVRYFTTNH